MDRHPRAVEPPQERAVEPPKAAQPDGADPMKHPDEDPTRAHDCRCGPSSHVTPGHPGLIGDKPFCGPGETLLVAAGPPPQPPLLSLMPGDPVAQASQVDANLSLLAGGGGYHPWGRTRLREAVGDGLGGYYGSCSPPSVSTSSCAPQGGRALVAAGPPPPPASPGLGGYYGTCSPPSVSTSSCAPQGGRALVAAGPPPPTLPSPRGISPDLYPKDLPLSWRVPTSAPDYAGAEVEVLSLIGNGGPPQASQSAAPLSLLGGTRPMGRVLGQDNGGDGGPAVPASRICDSLFDPDTGTAWGEDGDPLGGFLVRAACAAAAAGKDAAALCNELGDNALTEGYVEACQSAVAGAAARRFDFESPGDDVLPGRAMPWRQADAKDVDTLEGVLPYTSELYRAMYPEHTRTCEKRAAENAARVRAGGGGGIPCFPYTQGMKADGLGPPVHFWGTLPSGFKLFFVHSATWTSPEDIKHATGITPVPGDYLMTFQPYKFNTNVHPNGTIYLHLMRLTAPGQGDPKWGHETDRIQVEYPDIIRVSPGTPLPDEWRVPPRVEGEGANGSPPGGEKADGGGGGGGVLLAVAAAAALLAAG